VKGYLSALILAVIIVAFLIAFTLIPQQKPVMTKDEVQKLLLKDLTEQGVNPNEARVLSLNQSGDAWTATVIISKNQHSPCPTVEKREYGDVLKFKYRPETLINDCNQRASIALREEALINSAKLKTLAAITNANDAYGCAFLAKEVNSSETSEYCPAVDVNALRAFASGLPENSWIVYWTGANQNAFIALSPQNQVLKTS